MKYGLKSAPAREQEITYFNNLPFAGLSTPLI
jgi:hypothetical protein